MSRDLWEAFHADEVDEPELVSLLGHFFGLSRMEPGSDTVELFKPGDDGERPRLLLRYDDGLLVDIDSGPGLADEDLHDARQAIEQAALASNAVQVVRLIAFIVPETRGSWRYRNRFQLLPAPPEAPRPGMQLGAHPLVLEIALPRSDDFMVRLVRQRYRAWEIGLLLNLISFWRFDVPGDRHPHHWILEVTNDGGRNPGT